MNLQQAEVNDMHLGIANSKVPPSWSPERDKQYPLRTWTQDIRLWSMGTDVDVFRQGPVAAMRVGGTARELIRELDVQVLAQGMMLADDQGNPVQTSGLECLVRALHRRYAPLAQELEIHCLAEILLFRRQPGEDTDGVLARFELARDKALNGAGFDMSWVGFAFLLMSILGIHKSQWPVLLSPTEGSLPNTQVQYQAFIRYVRRQGHLTDKGVDAVKNMNFYTGLEQSTEHSYTVMPALSAWEQQPWPEQAYTYSEPEVQSEISSCNSGESEPDISDLFALSYPVAGEQLYMVYRHAKRRWRKFTGGNKRRFGKGKGKRSTKGKFGKGSGGKTSGFGFGSGFGKTKGKGKGKHYFAEPQYDMNEDYAYEQSYWTEDGSDGSWDQGSGIVYLGKGKFTRGNPVDKNGKKLECSLCGSTEHFIAKCPKNGKGLTHSQASAQPGGRTFAAMTGSQASSSSASEVTGWGSDWGSKIYFTQQAEPTQSYSVITLSDGTEVVLEETEALDSIVEEESTFPVMPVSTGIRNFYLPPDVKREKPSQLSRSNTTDLHSNIARQFAFVWFMPGAFHAQVKIAGGGPALLIDPGAYDNLVGDEWVKDASQEALKAGQGCAWQKLKSKLSVEGVGKESNEAVEGITMPVCLEGGETGTFTSPVIMNSQLPALLGLQSLTKRRALLDIYNKQIVFVGAGGYRLQLSPGSKTYKLHPAKTGHLMLPCQCWQEAKITPGKPGIAL